MNQISVVQQIIGWVGAVSLVLAYALLTFELVESQSVLFNVMQLLGAVSLGYRVYLDKNWSNLILNLFFGFVALYALAKVIF